MKAIYPIVHALLAAALLITPAAIADEAPLKDIGTIKVQAVTDYLAENGNAVILDVRTPIEYATSHVPGAVNINVQDDNFEQLVGQLDSDKTYIVYCTKNPVGGRSMSALGKMQALGFRDLVSLEGGHVAWSEANLPMTATEDPQE